MIETDALRLTTLLVAIVIGLFSTEYLIALRDGSLGLHSLMAWPIYSIQPRWLYRGWRGRMWEILFAPPVFGGLMIVRAFVAILATIYSATPFALLFIGLLFLISLLTNIRHVHGRDGADDMTTIVLAGLFVYHVAGVDSSLRWAGLLFVGAQATLSYVVSGVAKLVSPRWRSSHAIIDVLATQVYGRPTLLPIMKGEIIRRIATWSIIVWETSFLLFWLVPRPWCLWWLFGGILFHVGIAVIMGLNTFLVSFLSTYPILIFLRYSMPM